MTTHQYVIIALLIGTFFSASMLQFGREKVVHLTRLTWMGVGLVLVASTAIANPYLAAIGALIALNIKNHPQPNTYISTYLYPIGCLIAVYVAATIGLDRNAVVPLLLGVISIGFLTGLWGCYSLFFARWEQGYKHVLIVPAMGHELVARYQLTHPLWLKGAVLWEKMTMPLGLRLWIWESDLRIECGQMNPGHAQALAVVTASAAVGLAMTWHSWMLYAVPILLMPLLLVQQNQPPLWHPPYKRFSLTQGPLHLAIVGLSSLPLVFGVWGLLGAFLCVLGGFWYARRWDNDRMAVWKAIFVQYWVNQGWWVKLLGCGTGSWVYLHGDWIQAAQERGEESRATREIYTSAHNEYVQQLVEHGVVGLAAMMAFVVTSLYALAQNGPLGLAVYFPAVALASICVLHYPFDLYHEFMHLETVKTADGRLINVPQSKGIHGSSTMLILALLVLVLVELARWG